MKKNVMLLAGFVLGVLLCATGCGKKENVSILDGYITTQLDVSSQLTVSEALAEAEIVVDSGDRVTPGLDVKISELEGAIVIERKATVSINDGSNHESKTYVGAKVQDLLTECGIVLDDNDLLNVETEAYLCDGMEIQIVRRQEVQLEENGDTRTILTTATTIEELLEMEKINLGKNDRISPKRTKEIKEGMQICLKRVDVRKKVKYEPLPYKTEVKMSQDMEVGTTKVTQRGVNGKKKVTYEVTYVNGKEESRKVIKEKIVKAPVNQIVTKGEKQTSGERTVVSKEKVLDCDGSGHGYYIITYSDGTVEYEDF